MSNINKRYLWQSEGAVSSNGETFQQIFQRFASPAQQKSLFQLCAYALVVVQELSLTWFIHARYRVALGEQQQQQQHDHQKLMNNRSFNSSSSHADLSTICMIAALLLAVICNSTATAATNNSGSGSGAVSIIQQQQTRREKVRQRIMDAILLAVLLRILAAVLRSLTASYSADTVQRLTIASMVLHVLTCDYSYANGISTTTTTFTHDQNTHHHDESKLQEEKEDITKQQHHGSSYNHHRRRRHRPPFSGGTVSLNTVLFAMVLAVSRLESNVTAYAFVLLAVIIFAFFPATRHAIAQSFPPNKSLVLWLLTALVVTANMLLLDSLLERVMLVTCIVIIGFLLPLWQCHLQHSKILFRGTWDIPTAASMRVSANEANNENSS